MAGENNPVLVSVTITPTEISVDKPSIKADQGHTPIVWHVSADSTPGARITSVVFERDWPNPQPQPVGNEWKVSDNNTNPGPGTVSYKYDVGGTTPLGNPPVLDPTVDNQPPPGGGGTGP